MRVAVIGCGRMGAEPSSRVVGNIPAGWLPISHVEALNAIEGIESIALCDTNQELLQQRGKQYGIHTLYDDYRELINTNKPDLVTIATRTPSKCDIIKYACQAGVKGIYVEKPFANSMEELTSCLNIVKKHNVKLAYGVNRRYHPVYRLAKDLINNGEVGELIHITAEHGLSQLFWTHPHSVDLFLYFTSSFEDIYVQSHILPDSIVLKDKWVIDSDPVVESACFTFGSGVTANIVKTNGLSLRIGGAKGTLIVHANGSYLQLNRGNAKNADYFLEQKIITPLPSGSATVTAMTELLDAIKNNKPSPITLEDIELGMKMLFGCLWSSLHEGRRVNLNETPSSLIVTGKFRDCYA